MSSSDSSTASSTVRQRATDDGIKEKIEKRKEQNHLKKLQDNSQNRNRKRKIIWTLILIGLIILTWYYYYAYQPSISSENMQAPSKNNNNNNNNNNVHRKKSTKQPSKNPSGTAKNKAMPKTTPPSTNKNSKNKKPNPQAKPPSPKPDEILNMKITDLPILRRPIPPSDPDRPLIMEILEGDDYLRARNYTYALDKFNKILKRFKQSPRGILGKALALEGLANKKESIKFMDKAIDLYYRLSFDSKLASNDLKLAGLISLAECSERRGKIVMMIKALEKAVKLEPSHEMYSVKLAQAYIKGKKFDQAQTWLEKIVKKWPDNTLAHANLGYLYYLERNYSQALPHLLRGILENKEVQRSGKFYLYTGETLTRLNKSDEAVMVYKEGVARGFFPSVEQRSLYNEPDLLAKPWWKLGDTREQVLLELQSKTNEIKSEILSAMVTDADIFSDNKKSVITLYQRGVRQDKTCTHLPLLCNILLISSSITTCNRGETKVLIFHRGPIHIPSHVGLTNTKLRAVLPLQLSGPLKIRVKKETRELQEGTMSVIDDSFEQEILYSGKGQSVILMIDFWHPDLPELKRKYLRSL